jgi:hypothetical protein
MLGQEADIGVALLRSRVLGDRGHHSHPVHFGAGLASVLGRAADLRPLRAITRARRIDDPLSCLLYVLVLACCQRNYKNYQSITDLHCP